jgi:twitching motility two-component system response regulator PilH
MEANAPTDQRMSAAEQRQMQRKHLFCVNGSPEFLDVLRALFQDEHYNVTTTNYVPNTFDQIVALRPDAIIVDLEVTLRAGWDLLEHLAREAATRDMPVVITSTAQGLLDRAAADPARYGGRAYLVKPLNLDKILAAVRSLIGDA